MKTQFFRQKGFVFILGTILMVTFGTLNISYAQEANPTITASVEEPLTEATLHGSVVTLTLSGSVYTRSEFTISRALTVSGIGSVTFDSWDVDRVSDTKVTVELTFSGNIDTDTNLVFTVGAGGIADYDGAALTTQVPITAVAELLVATTESPLTEATLSGSVVTLTLSGRNFNDEWNVYNALTVSGIEGASFDKFDVERISGTKVTVPLTFSGNIDADATLTLTVGADAIVNYNEAFTFEFPVTAVEESISASTKVDLTEETLHGNVVTLTLDGRSYEQFFFHIQDAVSFSGIEGVTIDTFGVDRVSDTVITFELSFSGNFDEDATLTITVGADAIAGYPEGFTLELPVTAVEESISVSTDEDLTEATLDGNVVTLTLSGRSYEQFFFDVQDAVLVSGIDGVSIGTFGVNRASDTEITVELSFFGDFDEDGTLTLTVGADAIAGYDEALTLELSVPALQESLDASTEFPITEATLDGSIVTLTLSGRSYEQFFFDVQDAVLVSGIDGVSIGTFGVNRASDTEITVELSFFGDFDEDGTLTFTVGADAIAGYSQALTAQLPVTAVKQSNATISLSPNPIVSAPLEEQLTVNLNITGGENIAGYQAIVIYDASALRYVGSTKGDYLPADAFFTSTTLRSENLQDDTLIIDPFLELFGNIITEFTIPYVGIAATTISDASNGDGTLATLTFEVIDVQSSTLTLSHVYLVDADGERWEAFIEGTEVTEPDHDIFGDVNRDGVVNILDLILVSHRFGLRGHDAADVNGDGLVDIVDLVLVANAFGADAAAPSLNPQILEQLTAADVKGWLTQAQRLSITDPAYLRGITVLQQLHKALTPKETVLLPNFPNPFNPETWMPYHLSKDADVTLHIYAMNGTLVRTLTLGHQAAGIYQNRSRAAYWDGKNELGEKVASGVYFYTLTAGEFTATRKMLIRK
ncbi:MAG: cohesin domain-containing protein [Candidatus Poribacteria bacterium]|nr:cohesin domain-containing protein [Candidatus Poribacteria bacterium]